MTRVTRDTVVSEAKRIATEVAAKHADEVDRDARFPREAFDAMKEVGLLSAWIPTEFGGAGASINEIGAATEEFAAVLEGNVPFERCGNLEVAAERAALCARTSAAPGAIVLLSPACASFDQFPNFERRGDAFRAIVARLPGFVPRGGVEKAVP